MSDTATQRTVAEGMARLKELLFDTEVETLGELEKRLGSIEAVNARQSREQLEVLRRMEQLFERAGTEERFRISVASVLDKALTEAELRNHEEMSRAIAPLVINTIKTELRNSQDELVDIMFPITGRMVKSYVASEMKKLSESINNGIDRNPMMLRLRSIVSRRPISDLAIMESQRLVVTEVFLIRRGSGELLGSWPSQNAMSNANIHMGGLLAAINEFAANAFDDDGGSLKRFEYEGFDVHLRASPVYLLAAKCTGVAPSGIDRIIDDAFLATLERIGDLERQSSANGAVAISGSARSQELAPLVDVVEDRTGEVYDDLARTRFGSAIVKFVLFLIAVPLIAWLAWSLYTDAEEALVRRAAESVISSTPKLEGYQTSLDVGYRGRSIVVTGLMPDSETQRELLIGLQKELPRAKVEARLAVLPEPQQQRTVVQQVDTSALEQRLQSRIVAAEEQSVVAAIKRALERAEVRLGEAEPHLASLVGPSRDQATRDQLRTAMAALTRARSALSDTRERFDKAGGRRDQVAALVGPLNRARVRFDETILAIVTATGNKPRLIAPAEPPPAKESVAAAEELAARAERLATLVLALEPPAPPPPVVEVPQTASPDDLLRQFADGNAVFFAIGTDYVADDAASRLLDKAADLIKNGRRLVRVVGFTDERGSDTQNRSLAQRRADKIVGELVRRGVPKERLVGIGRLGDYALTPGAGSGSPNRRVQFELGFHGEARVTP